MTELLRKEQTISSFEIAQITGKKHAHVLRDIRTMEPAWEKVHKSKFGFMFKIINLPNRASRKDPYYELNKIEFLYVITKYSDEARARLIIRWAELEQNRGYTQDAVGDKPSPKGIEKIKRERFIVNQVKEQRFELICLIRQYMKRGDMAQVAKELGYNPSTVQDVMLGRQWNESIVKAMHQKAMKNKEQSLFDVRGMINELNQ